MEDNNKPIRVLIVDDHPAVRKGIQMLSATEPSVQIVGEAGGCQDATRQAINLQPDVMLMDLLMPEDCSLETIAEIKGQLPNVKIIVLTIVEDERPVKIALRAGADGYLTKDADAESLLHAIYAVQRGDIPLDPSLDRDMCRDIVRCRGPGGRKPLTAREKEVLRLMAQGLSNREMAEVLNLSNNTIKDHVGHIFEKLCVSGRIEAALLASQLGLISPE